MSTHYLLKRYEVCLSSALTLHPTYFDPAAWPKGKYVSQLHPLLSEFAPSLVARVGNVTCQIFDFPSAKARADWQNSLLVPHRDFGRLTRLAQTSNNTVNLFFDYEETVGGGGEPNIHDIKAARFCTALTPYSLAQHRDLLGKALALQF